MSLAPLPFQTAAPLDLLRSHALELHAPVTAAQFYALACPAPRGLKTTFEKSDLFPAQIGGSTEPACAKAAAANHYANSATTSAHSRTLIAATGELIWIQNSLAAELRSACLGNIDPLASLCDAALQLRAQVNRRTVGSQSSFFNTLEKVKRLQTVTIDISNVLPKARPIDWERKGLCFYNGELATSQFSRNLIVKVWQEAYAQLIACVYDVDGVLIRTFGIAFLDSAQSVARLATKIDVGSACHESARTRMEEVRTFIVLAGSSPPWAAHLGLQPELRSACYFTKGEPYYDHLVRRPRDGTSVPYRTGKNYPARHSGKSDRAPGSTRRCFTTEPPRRHTQSKISKIWYGRDQLVPNPRRSQMVADLPLGASRLRGGSADAQVDERHD